MSAKQENLETVRKAIEVLTAAEKSGHFNDIGKATLKFLITAERYLSVGLRWGLIEETAMDLSRAVLGAVDSST